MNANEQIIDRILKRERGYVNHPLDRGGPTNRGITIGALAAWRGQEVTAADVRELTEAETRHIYRGVFIVDPQFFRIEDDRLREQVIDAGVLHGAGWAARRLQECAGVTADGIIGPITLKAINFYGKINGLGTRFMQRRIHRIGRIVQADPSQIVFLTGWLDRAASFA